MGECLMAKAEHGLALAPNQSATKLAWLLEHLRPRTRSRPVLRHGRHVAGVDALERPAARHRPHQRRRDRAAASRRERTGTTGARDARHSRVDAAPTRRFDRRHRRGVRPARLPADRRHRRRPAGVAHRPGMRAPRAGPRSRSAPAACSTCAPVRRRRRPRTGTRERHLPDHRLDRGGRADVGAARRSCCRPAPTSSGSSRTSACSPSPAESHDGRGVGARRPTASCTCRRCSASARRSGTTAHGARCSGITRGNDPAHIVRAVLEGVAHRGADLVEAAEADTGLDHPDAADRRRHERQPDLRPGAGRRERQAGRGVAGHTRPPRSAPRSWPGWRSARGTASMSMGSDPATEARWWTRRVTRTGRGGPCRRAISRVDTRTLGSRLLELLRSVPAGKAGDPQHVSRCPDRCQERTTPTWTSPPTASPAPPDDAAS